MHNPTRALVVPLLLASVSVTGCGGEEDDASLGETTLAGTKTQGTKTQGTTLTSNLLYAKYAGGTHAGNRLTSLSIFRGELRGIELRAGVPHTLTGTGLTSSYLQATAPELPNLTQTLWIRGVGPRVGDLGHRGADNSGSTRLYDVRVRIAGSWQPLCETDSVDGTSWAIPVAAIWNDLGDRVETSTHFTFACSSGVIAKCYGWGYRPWIDTAHRDAHYACTRAARADYCGDGVSHTVTGTTINVYDELAPNAVQSRDAQRPDLMFEAGWTTTGARCLSHYRWEHLPIATPESLCPHPGRKTPFPQVGDPSAPAGWNCAAGTYLDPITLTCVPAWTSYQAPAGWVCETCAEARTIAKGLPMSMPIWECDDSANNVFVP